MKQKLIISILSVPVSYLVWDALLQFWGSNYGILSYSAGIIALLCLGLNSWILRSALADRAQAYAKTTAVCAGASMAASLAVLSVYVLAFASVATRHSA